MKWRRLRECVFCPKGQNLNSLSVSESSYWCFRCNKAGGLDEFQAAKVKYKLDPPTTRAQPSLNGRGAAAAAVASSFSPSSAHFPRLTKLLPHNNHVLLITGHTGVGKTTLLGQFCAGVGLPALYASLEQPLVRAMHSLHQHDHLYFAKHAFEDLDFAKFLDSVRFAHQALHVDHVFVDGFNRFPGTLEQNLTSWKHEFSSLNLIATVHPRKKGLNAVDSALRDLFLMDACLVLTANPGGIQLVDKTGKAEPPIPVRFVAKDRRLEEEG